MLEISMKSERVTDDTSRSTAQAPQNISFRQLPRLSLSSQPGSMRKSSGSPRRLHELVRYSLSDFSSVTALIASYTMRYRLVNGDENLAVELANM